MTRAESQTETDSALKLDRAPVYPVRGVVLTLIGCGLLLLVSLQAAKHVAELSAPLNPLMGESRTGTAFKLLLDAIFGLLATRVVHAGLRLFDPRREDPSAHEAQLVRLVTEERARVPEYRPVESERFEELSTEDLIAVYHSISREEYPDRFAAILWVMYRRASRTVEGHAHPLTASEK